jgi:hypothetical protein
MTVMWAWMQLPIQSNHFQYTSDCVVIIVVGSSHAVSLLIACIAGHWQGSAV